MSGTSRSEDVFLHQVPGGTGGLGCDTTPCEARRLKAGEWNAIA